VLSPLLARQKDGWFWETFTVLMALYYSNGWNWRAVVALSELCACLDQVGRSTVELFMTTHGLWASGRQH
jgi:hypothetical protein